MKREGSLRSIVLLILVAGAFFPLRAQTQVEGTPARFFDVTVGLGIDAHFASSVADYVNLVAQPRLEQRVDIVGTAAEFFASVETQIADEWSAGIEYGLLVKSFLIDDRSGFARSDISYNVHMPTILVHRLIIGDGYRVKAGGGFGYHFCAFRQQFQPFGTDEALKAEGLSFKLEAVGNTKFDDTFYGSIGVDLRWDFLGTLERRDAGVTSGRTIKLPSMNFFNAGIKFGVTFQLN